MIETIEPNMHEENLEREYLARIERAQELFEEGQLEGAAEMLVETADRDSKRPDRIKLLRDIFEKITPVTEESVRREPWQLSFLFHLYQLWPKTNIEGAILKHSFPEQPSQDEWTVSGAEQVHLTKYGFELKTKWGVLSRGKFWLKLWDLETGKVIRADDHGLQLLASTIGRDGSHVLFSQSWHHSEAGGINWSTSFRETFRRYSSGRGDRNEKSQSAHVKYYRVKGKIVSMGSEREVEIDREECEKNPVKGFRLPPRKFKPHTKGLLEYWAMLPKEISEPIIEEDKQAREREKHIVRVRIHQTLTLEHEAIESYLPAGTTTFTAVNGWLAPKASDLWPGLEITADVGVEDDEAWLEDIITAGHGLKGMYGIRATTPITSVCISADGSLAMRNGHGDFFGIWNLWTGDCLREFHGHMDRVTCLCLSVDVSLAVSGSEDKTIRLWKPITAECVRVLVGHENAIAKVCIGLAATNILSADRGGFIKVWDVRTGECLRTIRAHRENISGLALTFDGRFAVTGSWDKTVKVWNLVDGSCIRTFEHDDWVTSVDITPDGRYLASSSYAGTQVWELLWRLDPRDLAEWDEGARPYLEILMNANASWEGKLGQPIDMTEAEIKDSLRRNQPSWTAPHWPNEKIEWNRSWHLPWDVIKTLGDAGYGWLTTGPRIEGDKFQEEWRSRTPPKEAE